MNRNIINTFLATVQKLASMHALGRNKQLNPLLVSVWVTEHNLCQRSTTPWVMNQILQCIVYITMISAFKFRNMTLVVG